MKEFPEVQVMEHGNVSDVFQKEASVLGVGWPCLEAGTG